MAISRCRSGERAELMECSSQKLAISRVENSDAPPPAALRVMEELFSSRISMSRCTIESSRALAPICSTGGTKLASKTKCPEPSRTMRATGRVERSPEGSVSIDRRRFLRPMRTARSSAPEFSSCKTRDSATKRESAPPASKAQL